MKSAMLPPTKITVNVVLWFVMVIAGTAMTIRIGAENFSLYGGIAGGILGLALGHVLGILSHTVRTRRLLRKIDRSSDDELQRLVNLDHWNFTQSFALLVLAARDHDVRDTLPRIIAMLESPSP